MTEIFQDILRAAEKRSPAEAFSDAVVAGHEQFTEGALDTFSSEELDAAFGRHIRGDWGDVSDGDRASNDDALFSGDRIMSIYDHGDGRVLGFSRMLFGTGLTARCWAANR